MHRLSLSLAWDQTRAILSSEGRLLVAVGLALVVLPQVLLAVAGAPMGVQATFVSQVVYIAVILLGFVAQVALNRLAIGPSVTVRDAIAQGLVRVASVLGAMILLSLALMAVAVVLALLLAAMKLITIPVAGQAPPPAFVAFLVIVAMLAFAIFQLIFPLAAVETGNPLRLLSRSWQLGRPHYLPLLAFSFVVFVGLAIIAALNIFVIGSVVLLLLGPPNAGSLAALILGLIAGIIQAGFTVVTAVMLVRIYVQIAGDGRTAEVSR